MPGYPAYIRRPRQVRNPHGTPHPHFSLHRSIVHSYTHIHSNFVDVHAVFLRDHLPDDFIPPPPHAITAGAGMWMMLIIDHGDLNGTPSILKCGCFPVPLFVLVSRALPLVWSPSPVHFNILKVHSIHTINMYTIGTLLPRGMVFHFLKSFYSGLRRMAVLGYGIL